MATSENGINYAKTIAVPAEKVDPGEINGRVKVLQEKFSLSAALTINSTIACPKLPVNAKPLRAFIRSSDMGGTGQFSLGYLANGVDSADTDAFVAACDAGDAAALTHNTGLAAEAGILKRFSVETQVVITVLEATTATSGDVEIVIEYVID